MGPRLECRRPLTNPATLGTNRRCHGCRRIVTALQMAELASRGHIAHRRIISHLETLSALIIRIAAHCIEGLLRIHALRLLMVNSQCLPEDLLTGVIYRIGVIRRVWPL